MDTRHTDRDKLEASLRQFITRYAHKDRLPEPPTVSKETRVRVSR